jgi:hypothetical protein
MHATAVENLVVVPANAPSPRSSGRVAPARVTGIAGVAYVVLVAIENFDVLQLPDRVLGGCCGTNHMHVGAISAACRSSS